MDLRDEISSRSFKTSCVSGREDSGTSGIGGTGERRGRWKRGGKTGRNALFLLKREISLSQSSV